MEERENETMTRRNLPHEIGKAVHGSPDRRQWQRKQRVVAGWRGDSKGVSVLSPWVDGVVGFGEKESSEVW